MSNEKRLLRSVNHKKIFGVCGGYADYFGVDVTWVRLFFIGATVAATLGLWVYLVSAIIMPKNTEESPPYSGKRIYRTRGKEAVLFGVCGGLAKHLGIDSSIFRIVCAVLALMGIGILLYIVMGIVLPVEGASEGE